MQVEMEKNKLKKSFLKSEPLQKTGFSHILVGAGTVWAKNV